MESLPQGKFCRICYNWKELGAFSPSKRGWLGTLNTCKSCRKAGRKMPKPPKGFKWCCKCGKEKPRTLEYFYKNVQTKDGLRSDCKVCADITTHVYYTKNKETINKQRVESGCREKQKEWAATPRGKALIKASRVKTRPYRRTWEQGHRENNRFYYRAKGHRRRVAKKGNGGFHTAEDIQKQLELQKHRCWWCRKSIRSYFEVDHVIPIAKGGSDNPDNIVCTCRDCNRTKSARSPLEVFGRLF